MAGKRRSNGEGSFHVDPRGRWVGRGYVEVDDGTRRRISVVGRTRVEAYAKLRTRLDEERRADAATKATWTVGEYLDYWFKSVVQLTKKDRTQEFYESAIRLYLKPGLGQHKLAQLGVQEAQRYFNRLVAEGVGPRTIQKTKQTLRSALSQAEREEVVLRNVARLVVLPKYSKKPIVPWPVEAQRKFLAAARDHRWHAAFLLMLVYGIRRGEVLGLRWQDIELDQGLVHIRQQLQRVSGKGLVTASVKTAAGDRVLPLIDTARHALETIDGREGLVFRSTTGSPVDPKNFVRAFHEIREGAGLPFITVHHLRHSAATTMKDLGAAATDAQSILGHAHVSTTMQIYTHSTSASQRAVLDRLGTALVSPMGNQMGIQAIRDVASSSVTAPVATAEAA